MAKDFLTDEQVDIEIERLKASPYVALAKHEQAVKNRRRQYMYSLRWLEKRGRDLAEMGVTDKNLADMENDMVADVLEVDE